MQHVNINVDCYHNLCSFKFNITSKHRTSHIVYQTSHIVHQTLIKHYLLLIATTGSIWAAMDAGIMPAAIPIPIQMEIASVSMPGEI